MIDAPRTIVSVSSADSLKVNAADDVQDAVITAITRWQAQLAPPALKVRNFNELPFKLKVDAAPRHQGLGSGTQLAFAVATALQVAFDQPIPSSEDLAGAMDRGKRSAIGSYGFHQGGFLVDRGIEDEAIAPLDMRIDFPEAWKIVLIQPKLKSNSIHGEDELKAFKELPATSVNEANFLAGLLRTQIVPAILSKEFSSFASSVFDYGYRSGMFYEPIQGGAYASDVAASIVERVSKFGEYAIGQSSWGPLIFAISRSEKEASKLVDYLREHGEDVACHVAVASADNRGMVVQLHST